MYYYVYLIVNLINGKYYIGAHATNNLHDGYMGSGYLIQAAIEKYGVEYFVKEILRYCDTREEMFEYEAELVTQDLVDDPMCYNMKLGGIGGREAQFTPEEMRERVRMHHRNAMRKRKEARHEYMRTYYQANKETIQTQNRANNEKESYRKRKHEYMRTYYQARKKAVQNAQ